MALHLIKLCVGCDSVADLEDWIKEKLKEKKRRGQKAEHIHTTRMVPKRADELTSGGSLYWVSKGIVSVRQEFIDIRPRVKSDGALALGSTLDGLCTTPYLTPAPIDKSRPGERRGRKPRFLASLRDASIRRHEGSRVDEFCRGGLVVAAQ